MSKTTANGASYNPILVGDADQIAYLVASLCPDNQLTTLLPSTEEVEARLGLGTHRWYLVKPEEMIRTVVELYEEKLLSAGARSRGVQQQDAQVSES